MRDIMVDLETMGSTPGCAILSIGAVAFGVDVKAESMPIDKGMYSVVSLDSCRRAFLHEDPETVQWWSRQKEEARAVIAQAKAAGATPLAEALEQLNDYVLAHGGPTKARVWGNGSDFDNAILAVAFPQVGIKPVWKFWNNRCYRTLKSLAPGVELVREGTYHNALDDAISQAKHMQQILRAKPALSAALIG